jgi:hypothetical protein
MVVVGLVVMGMRVLVVMVEGRRVRRRVGRVGIVAFREIEVR